MGWAEIITGKVVSSYNLGMTLIVLNTKTVLPLIFKVTSFVKIFKVRESYIYCNY